MNRVKTAVGYTIAFLMVPLVLATLMGMGFWSKELVAVTGLSVTPWYTGGEVVRMIDHGQFETRIHRPVFDGFLWDSNQGFVQVDWAADRPLPARVEEEIDYDGDGTADFRVELNTQDNTAKITTESPHVLLLEGTYNLKNGRAIRVSLKNKR
ncbi:MAG: hypothetical protein ABSH28_21415 [Acidobacteriota bacterium]|jgi:hypothetical protein